MNDRKYYHIENCNRHVQAGSHRLIFEPYEQVGGCWFGVYATDNPSEIKELDKLAESKKSAVSAISAVDYEKAQKKKSLTQPEFGPSKGPSARAFSGDAPDVAFPNGRVSEVDPDLNVPEVPRVEATPQSAGDNVGQVAAPAPAKSSKSKQ